MCLSIPSPVLVRFFHIIHFSVPADTCITLTTSSLNMHTEITTRLESLHTIIALLLLSLLCLLTRCTHCGVYCATCTFQHTHRCIAQSYTLHFCRQQHSLLQTAEVPGTQCHLAVLQCYNIVRRHCVMTWLDLIAFSSTGDLKFGGIVVHATCACALLLVRVFPVGCVG
jgi:hypothetical protein